mgnify:CR=1 FL=1|jgi:hypothetical protein
MLKVGYTKVAKMTPSLKPYALDLTSANRDENVTFFTAFQVRALWIGRKNGKTTVTEGVLYVHPRNYSITGNVETILSMADTSSGGAWEYVWNGSTLQVNPNNPLSPAEAIEKAAFLDEVLKNLPAVPEGFDGWYYRNSTI